MRILQISSAKTFGGGEKHLVDLCNGLVDRNHDVFVSLRNGNDWKKKLNFLPEENLVDIAPRNSFGVFSALRIAKFIKDRKIDIVHAHLARDYPAASLAVRVSPGTKLILTRHVLFPVKRIHKLILGNTSKVIAVSTAVEVNLRRIFSNEKIVCIPNGIDVEKWSNVDSLELRNKFRGDFQIPLDAPLIGTVGELKKLKGQEDFILAANEVLKKHPETRFVIVGKDNSFDQSFRRKLKRLVKVMGLEKRFLFLDWIEDTSPLLAAFDVFVSASHSESFGLAILEAMASGTAVVVTETAGAKELISNNKTGILVPVNDPVKLAKNVCSLLESKEKQEKLGAAAQRSATENYGLDKMITSTENIYR